MEKISQALWPGTSSAPQAYTGTHFQQALSYTREQAYGSSTFYQAA